MQDNSTASPLVANPAIRPRPHASDDPNVDFAAHRAWQAEREAWKATTRPVTVVGLDLPFGTVVALWFQVTIINVLVAAVVVLALLVLGIL